MTSEGFRTDPAGGIAAPPFTGDAYTFGAHMTFTGGVSAPGNGGRPWFCDSVNGLATNSGKSWNQAFNTITLAVAAASAGDTIYLKGTFTEAVTVSTASLTFIGAGPTPNDNVWMESAADDDLVTLSAANCRFYNIRFRIPTAGGRGIVMSGADYTVIQGNLFQGRGGSHHAVTEDGSNDNCKIIGNTFMYNNTASDGAAIFGHTYAADVVGSNWLIKDNIFHSNLRHVVMRARQSQFVGNLFQEDGLDTSGETALTATVKLDLSGTLSKLNVVTKNTMLGDYSNTGGYEAGTEDNWFGNTADDVSESEVTADGVTTAVPAA